MKINYTQLNIKLHYFLFVASTGVSFPYVPIYGKQLGVSPLIFGILCTIISILHVIAKPVFGFIVDYFQRKRLILMILAIISTGSFIVIFFLPSYPILLDHHFQNVSCASLSHCDMESHASASCNSMKDTTCHWVCKDTNFSMRLSFHADQQKEIISDTACLLNMNETSLCQGNVMSNNCNFTCDDFEDQCVYTSIAFWGFVFFWSLGDISCHVTFSLSDAFCFGILGKDKQLKFGKQRLWATIGYGVAACLSGYMTDLWSQGKIYNSYIPMLILAIVFICIDLICCIKLELRLESGSTTILKDVFALLKSKHNIIFLCFATFAGILFSVKRHFLLWYVEELAIATGYMSKIKLLEGLIIAAESFDEIVFFFFSGKILKKLGYGYTFVLCFVCYAIRLGLISLSPMPWWILPIELIMYGPTYALCLATIIAYANVVAPPGASGTMQGLVQGMHDGFGLSIGSLIGGTLYKIFGGTMMLRIFSAFAAFLALIYFILHTLYLKHETPDLCYEVEWKTPDDARRHCVTAET